MRDLLVRELEVGEGEVYTLPEPLDLRGLNLVADIDLPELHYPTFVPKTHRQLAEVESAPGDATSSRPIRERDVLLHHPYDSFSTSVQAFLEQAAADPHVLAIKQTLYRTSGDSPIVDALIDAAEAGKQVLALVEIKARFDEQANITWARKLEQAGVHVVYGIVGLKTHAKLSLVVRQEGERPGAATATSAPATTTRRPPGCTRTSGVLTCDPAVGDDLSRLFNQLSGYAPKTAYRRLLVAPRSLRSGLIDRIEREIANARGRPARGHPDQGQLDRRRGADRRALPGLAGRRAGRRRRPRHLRDPARRARACARTSGCAASSGASWSTPGSSGSPAAASRWSTSAAPT